ncbi:unnamed protein product [Protopolystoma xenopodis]|uniref:Uncharacterized protein n=1 Tax=Protopolystoma xenopodis TaxID=117903 RepID=A0A3S5BE55_9PLAT|nr:unnamed protein product [Protopolystoma xenopodis]
MDDLNRVGRRQPPVLTSSTGRQNGSISKGLHQRQQQLSRWSSVQGNDYWQDAGLDGSGRFTTTLTRQHIKRHPVSLR